MKRFFSQNTEDRGLTSSRGTRIGAGPLLVLLLAGLLADVAPHDEAHAGLAYALSLLALLGATGSIACLTYHLSLHLDPLPWTGPTTSGLPATAAFGSVSERGEDWPLLLALLFGPFVVLLAGLGGWV